jgi:hypothetical protein
MSRVLQSVPGGRGAQRAVNNRGLLRDPELLRAFGPRAIHGEARDAVRVVAIEPPRYRRARHAKPLANGEARHPARRRKHNLGALDDALFRRPRADELLQPLAIAASQREGPNRERREHQHTMDTLIVHAVSATPH